MEVNATKLTLTVSSFNSSSSGGKVTGSAHIFVEKTFRPITIEFGDFETVISMSEAHTTTCLLTTYLHTYLPS